MTAPTSLGVFVSSAEGSASREPAVPRLRVWAGRGCWVVGRGRRPLGRERFFFWAAVGAGAAAHRCESFFYQGGLRLGVSTRWNRGPAWQCSMETHGAALGDTGSVILLCAGAIGCPIRTVDFQQRRAGASGLRDIRMDPEGRNDNLCHYTRSGKLRVLEELFGEYVTPVPKEFMHGRSDGRTS